MMNATLNYNVTDRSWSTKSVRLVEGATLADLTRIFGITSVCKYDRFLESTVNGWVKDPDYLIDEKVSYHVEMPEDQVSRLEDTPSGTYFT
jgi:hypothetical protein